MEIREKKYQHSKQKTAALAERLQAAPELESLKDLTIFVSGSYARLEASEHSDIDLFFIQHGKMEKIEHPNISSLRMFSKVISISDSLNFPKFSNDGEFLRILESKEILKGLGGRSDDYDNHFTARLLMILESSPVFNDSAYQRILKEILAAYFKDYPDHPRDFQPIFLVNDILRFWKTLCLNYENKRNQPSEDHQKKLKQKIKNLKLKFSRMLTCYGSIAYIVSKTPPIDVENISTMIELAPLQRLEEACCGLEGAQDHLEEAKRLYSWFLEATDVTEEKLLYSFDDKSYRAAAFGKADEFGEQIFNITRTIAEHNNYLRFLLV